MKNIFDIIGRLTKEEKRNFKLYLYRIGGEDSERKVEQLFDLVNSGSYDKEQEISELLYGNNKNAYYRLKNRLLGDLEKSLLLLHSDLNDRINIWATICVADIYMEKSLFKEAYELLKQCEKEAEKKDYHDVLFTIYGMIAKMSFQYEEISLEYYLQKEADNLAKYTQRMQTERLLQTIAYRLVKANFDVSDEHLAENLNYVREQLQVSQETLNSPRMQLEISNVIRRSLLQKKDFAALETYLISSYNDFVAKNIYDRESHATKIVTIVWIINTLIKNKKMTEVPQYVRDLHDNLLAYNKLFYERYLWTYHQCLEMQYFYGNQTEQAIALLEQISKENHPKGILYYDVYVLANLGVLYFCRQQLAKALHCIAPLFYKDTYNKLPAELQLRISILECLLHFDHDDIDFVAYKLNDIKNSQKKLLKQPAYTRENALFKILKRCVITHNPFKDKAIIGLVQEFSQQSPSFSPGSNEFINYRIWLESKLKKQPYYALLLAEMQP